MGERKGAKIAAPYKRRRRQAEIIPAGRRRRERRRSAAITYSGIGPGEGEVRKKIAHDKKRAGDDDGAKDDELIFTDEGFIDEASEAWIVHDILD